MTLYCDQIMQLDIQTPGFPALIPLMALANSKPIAVALSQSEAFLPAFLSSSAPELFAMKPSGAQLESMTLLGALLKVAAMVSNCDAALPCESLLTR